MSVAMCRNQRSETIMLSETFLNDIFTETADFVLIEQDADAASSARLLEAEQKSNCKHVILSGRNCHTMSDFMQEVFDKLNFPPYFGRNWSAFSDSFQERLREEEDHYQRYLLMFTDADELLSEADEDDLSALLKVLQDSIEAMADPERIMAIKIIFCLTGAAKSRIGRCLVDGNQYLYLKK
jgi:hypothetical protein